MSFVSRLRDKRLLVETALVGGEWVGRDAAGIVVENPADGTVVGVVPDLGADATRRANDAAEAAFGAWRARPAETRAALLERWHAAMLEHAEDLALIMTMEQGKPLAEARSEIAYAASFVKWFAEEARRVRGEIIPASTADRRVMVLRQPIGVSAAITPWNFPAAMITRKCAPALAAGCPVVVKPSELTPFSAIALAVLAERVGFPPGIIIVVTGRPVPIAEVMTGDPRVRKLSFTGSTAVGRILMRQSAETIKRLSLELGGNAPFIVFDDADIDAAIAGVMASKFRNAGQTCVCANRILVQSGIHDKFVDRLAKATVALRVGNGMEYGVTIGPLISDAAREKVLAHIEDARTHGATLIVGGGADERGGRFVQPTVLVDATAAMRLANEETFGPVAPVFRFDADAEAIAFANDTPYGLAAYFYTRDIARSWRVAEALDYGMVGHNCGVVSMDVAPFGGVKQSGLGREGSQHGIEEYLELKTVHAGGIG